MAFRRTMISRRAEAENARTRLLPTWIAKDSLPTNEFNSLFSIGLPSGAVVKHSLTTPAHPQRHPTYG